MYVEATLLRVHLLRDRLPSPAALHPSPLSRVRSRKMLLRRHSLRQVSLRPKRHTLRGSPLMVTLSNNTPFQALYSRRLPPRPTNGPQSPPRPFQPPRTPPPL